MFKKLSFLAVGLLSLFIISCEDEGGDNLLIQAEREEEIFREVLKNRNIDLNYYHRTESGMYYYYLKANPTGTVVPASETVSIDYKGEFIYGLSFDQGTLELQGETGRILQNQDSCFVLSGGVIPGWIEAINILKTGEKATFLIPSQLAYGSGGNSSIPGNSPLEFDIEIGSTPTDTTGRLCN